MVEMARCVLKTMRVPLEFWGEAVCTVVYTLNRSPTKSLNKKTLFEAWHGKKPRVSHLRTFGCVARVKMVGLGLKKLSDRSNKMVFIGYESGTKGYRFFDPSTKKLVISRDVIFYEKQSWDWANANSDAEQTSGSFIVHYELSDRNPTIGEMLCSQQQKRKGVDLLIKEVQWVMMKLHLTPRIVQGQLQLKVAFLQHHQAKI